MVKNYKYRLYPSPEQAQLLNQNMGCCRFVYNWALDLKIKDYESKKDLDKSERQFISINDISKQLPTLKEEYPFLKDAIAASFFHSLRHLDAAYKNFFKKGGFPKFKSKYKNKASMAFHQGYTISGNEIKVPKIGWIPFVLHREMEGISKTITITRNPSNRYYITITTHSEQTPPVLDIPEKKVGLDVGVINSVTLSDGFSIANGLNDRIKPLFKKLQRLQRDFSRKEKGSNNRYKARVKLARQHERISDARDNYNKEIAAQLGQYLISTRYTEVYLQSYDVKNMIKKEKAIEKDGHFEKNGQKVNRIKKRPVLDAGLGSLCSAIKSKLAELGISAIEVDGIDSNKYCSSCDYYDESFEIPRDRVFACPNCGATQDVDLNRAKNLLKENYLQKAG